MCSKIEWRIIIPLVLSFTIILHIEVSCDSLSCAPYNTEMEITCVINVHPKHSAMCQ